MAKRASNILQNKLKSKLEKIFEPSLVEKEWGISKRSTDNLRRNKKIYAPRLDVAIGPFNRERGYFDQNRQAILNASKHPLVQTIISDYSISTNHNPRCLLAIEISFSGSSKHMLGDMANASIMGLVGIIITNKKNLEKVKRISNYISLVSDLGKTSSNLFNNRVIFLEKDFLRLLDNYF